MSYDFFSSFLPSHSLTDSINFIDLLNYFMKQTGFVASRGRSALSDAQISDEHVAQVNYQFSVLYITPFVSYGGLQLSHQIKITHIKLK